MEKEIATHSSVLALRIPGTGEPGGLPSMGSHRIGHDWSDLAAAAAQIILWGYSNGSAVKESICNPGNLSSVSGLGRSPGGGNTNPFQYACLETPMVRGAWQSIVHRAAKSQTQLNNWALIIGNSIYIYYIFNNNVDDTFICFFTCFFMHHCEELNITWFTNSAKLIWYFKIL